MLKELLEKYFKDQLTEEASTEITTLFESAINEGIKRGVEAKEAELDEANETAMADFKNELVQKLSEYTELAVGEFLTENAPAIEASAKVAIAETVMAGVANVLKEQYIVIPEEETNVVADLESKVAGMEEKLNGAINSDIENKKQILEYEKALSFKKLISESELTDVDAEKVLELLDGIDADSIETFEEKTGIIIAKVKDDAVVDTTDVDGDTEDLNESADADADTDSTENLDESDADDDNGSAIDQYLPENLL